MLLDGPVYDDEAAPLPEGEIVVAAVPSGPGVTLRFASPYEPWLGLDGRRVVDETSAAHRTLLTWLGRRKLALFRVLDVMHGLRATLTSTGVVVTDLVQLDDLRAAAHTALATCGERLRVKVPGFAALGDADHRVDLGVRVRALYAAGTPIELRVEDRGVVVSRRRLRVGR